MTKQLTEQLQEILIHPPGCPMAVSKDEGECSCWVKGALEEIKAAIRTYNKQVIGEYEAERWSTVSPSVEAIRNELRTEIEAKQEKLL
jgi:hypothetical protein